MGRLGTAPRLHHLHRGRKDLSGESVELRATYDPATRGGDAPDGRRPKAALQWVSGEQSIDCEVCLSDRPLNAEDREEEGAISPPARKLEPSIGEAAPGRRYQFERPGYFCVDDAEGRWANVKA